MNLDGQKCNIKISLNGRLQFYDLEKLQEVFLDNKNFEGYITFHRVSSDLESMHKLYRWWVSDISDHTGESKENTDEDLCCMFLSYQKYNAIAKKTITLIKSKDDLSYNDWIVFLRKINSMAMENLGFMDEKNESTLPIPNNLKSKI